MTNVDCLHNRNRGILAMHIYTNIVTLDCDFLLGLIPIKEWKSLTKIN